MSKVINLRRGLDIRVRGEAAKEIKDLPMATTFAVKPTDFIGITPKLTVNEGDKVQAGSIVFFNKYSDRVKFASPVSGKVAEIRRGERRKLLEVVIEADKEISYKDFGKADPSGLGRDQIIEKLLDSGLWPCFIQRPYAIIANPEDKPKSIFISGFDSAPLAPDYNLLISGQEKVFQTGIDVLKKLTDGKVHLTLNGRTTPEAVFSNAAGVQINKISGPHPAGCVGIQIHHIDPINKNDIVWTVNPMDVARIGKLFTEGKYDAQKIVALAGPGVKEPRYYRTMTGACIEDMVSGNVIDEELRYISGNPLTGSRIAKKGFLGFYHYQVSVLEEGIKPLFFGWGMPSLKRFSVSRSFLSWLMSKKQFNITTNYHGSHRAYVVTGQYEKVLPMDILPVYLMKSIIVKDIDKMEALGIYEVAEEDLALCEFVCTSKIEVQSIVREGIDLMIKELS